MKPLIGITTGEIQNIAEPWSPITYGQSHTYSDAIIQAGGLPVLLPITSDPETIKQMCHKLDGILFAGGNDIDPKLYNQELYPETVEISAARDDMEIQLLRMALQAELPILAICRGMQLLNVIKGGSLYQHIQTDLAGASDHEVSTRKKTRLDLAHQLQIAPDSKLADILGSDIVAANTHHHQAVHRLGDGLSISAQSEDGVIEGIESHGENFIIGVQCHPESLSSVEPKWDLLFESFVESARS